MPPTSAAPKESFVPLCIPHVQGNEWKYIKECLDTNWVSSVGVYVDRFERDLAAYVGTKHAVATINGTAALHIALLVSGVEPNDEVVVSTLSFIAPANAIRYAGAWPVFVDVEPDYWQMDPRLLAEFLEQGCRWANGELRNKKTGRRVKALLPVHILGHPVDMDPVLELAKKYNLVIIEDATESLGAKYKGRSVGHLGDIACFSFNGNKVITTGGGGMIVTDNEEWARRAKYLTTQAKDDAIEFVHNAVGYNYRLTNIQAAMGCAQLEQLESFIAAKRRIASTYEQALRHVSGLRLPQEAPWAFSSCWLYAIDINAQTFGMDSRALLKKLKTAGIETRPFWQPLHQSQAHRGCEVVGGAVAERLNRDGLTLPSSVALDTENQRHVLRQLLPS